jgi:hypothetical protein
LESNDVQELDLRVERQSSALGALARHACFVRANLEECLRRINEVAIATLDVARSSIWFLAEDGLSLTCADMIDPSGKTRSDGRVLKAADYPRYFKAILEDRVIAAADARLTSAPRNSPTTT